MQTLLLTSQYYCVNSSWLARKSTLFHVKEKEGRLQEQIGDVVQVSNNIFYFSSPKSYICVLSYVKYRDVVASIYAAYQ